MDLSITIDRLKVIAGPETIKLRTSVGGTGQRGSLWLAGAGKPSTSNIPNYNDLITYDMYVDTSDGRVYQYIFLPSNTHEWVPTGLVIGG